MGETPDRESKTQEASPRRIEDALKKGNTPYSREVGNAAGLIAVGLVLPFVAPGAADRLVQAMFLFLDRPDDFAVDNGEGMVALAWRLGWLVGMTVGPLMLVLMVTGVLASNLQNPPRMVLHRIRPELSRLSLSKGLSRVMGSQGRVEFGKAIAKIAVVCSLFYALLKGGAERAEAYLLMRHDSLPVVLAGELAWLFLASGMCMTALALVDVVWTRLKWRIDLRMSLHELKEEQKQAEGDPIVRARQRSLARERARQRMIATVPQATVVVVNPTHYAVAMRYVQGEMAAPMVLAKGLDYLALRIREIAEEHDIPVVEDRMLARSLYGAVKADQPIPPEFYRAIAEIILFLMSRQKAAAGPVQSQARLQA